MKLIELSSNQESFRTIRFNPTGMSIIKGTHVVASENNQTLNGVGKTLAARIVDFCLGGRNPIRTLKNNIPDWIFKLTLSLNNQIHLVERSADGNVIRLDERNVSYRELSAWFTENSPFTLPEFSLPDNINPQKKPSLTYRGLLTRFIRFDDEDFLSPICLRGDSRGKNSSQHSAILKNLYLLGADYHLAVSKWVNKLSLDSEKNTLKDLRENETLRRILRFDATPQITLDSLKDDIDKLEQDIESFEIAEDYRELEKRINKLASDLKSIYREISVIEYNVARIDDCLTVVPDIAQSDLLDLYEGLLDAFKPEVLEHFENVETFHHVLEKNRNARLLEERSSLLHKKSALLAKREEMEKEKNLTATQIKGKGALDEYVALAKKLAQMKEDYERLRIFLEYKQQADYNIVQIQETMSREDVIAQEYAISNPLSNYDSKFREIARLLYPNKTAGIALENNSSAMNLLRYNLSVQIDSQASSGVKEAIIAIYDWLILTHGVHHTIGFQWHDSKLFANIDHEVRAKWFQYSMENSVLSGKQYIISLNSEAYDSTLNQMDNKQQKAFEAAVVLSLSGEDPKSKLLGVNISDFL